MEDMSQEFVTEQGNEGILNKEIETLFQGIDEQSSPTCIPSTYPEENLGTTGVFSPILFPDNTQEDGITKDKKEMPEEGLFPEPALNEEMSKEKLPPILQPFSCSAEKTPEYISINEVS